MVEVVVVDREGDPRCTNGSRVVLLGVCVVVESVPGVLVDVDRWWLSWQGDR